MTTISWDIVIQLFYFDTAFIFIKHALLFPFLSIYIHVYSTEGVVFSVSRICDVYTELMFYCYGITMNCVAYWSNATSRQKCIISATVIVSSIPPHLQKASYTSTHFHALDFVSENWGELTEKDSCYTLNGNNPCEVYEIHWSVEIDDLYPDYMACR